MDFLTAVKVVVRRWYVALPVLIVAAIVTQNVVQGVPPSFRANGSVIVASPGLPRGTDPSAPPVAVNPLTNLDYTASVVASIVAGLMQDRAVKEELVAQGADPSYTLGTPPNTNAPLLGIEATAESPDKAVETVRLVIQGIQDQLERRQGEAGAPPDTWIRAIVLTSPTEAERQTGGKVRAAVALGALSLAAAVSMAFLAESIAFGRKRRTDETASTQPVGRFRLGRRRNSTPVPEALRAGTAEAVGSDRGTTVG